MFHFKKVLAPIAVFVVLTFSSFGHVNTAHAKTQDGKAVISQCEMIVAADLSIGEVIFLVEMGVFDEAVLELLLLPKKTNGNLKPMGPNGVSTMDLGSGR